MANTADTTEEVKDSLDDSKKRDMWLTVQRELAARVCVPRITTAGLLEQYAEEPTMFSASTFTLPEGLLADVYSRTVLGLQLQRDAKRREDASLTNPPPLQYVGGVDISFVKGTNLAVACLVVMEYPSMQQCYTLFHECEVTEPYVPGFLAFREVTPLVELMNKARAEICNGDGEKGKYVFPQLLLVDGCGVLHPSHCGLASHLGVLMGLPTIGCAKNLMAVDGMTRELIDLLFAADAACESDAGEVTTAPLVRPLIGESGTLWGYAVRPNRSVKKPMFISPGHCVGYAEAAALVLSMCKHRVPEPIRAADISSREYIRRITCEQARGEKGKKEVKSL